MTLLNQNPASAEAPKADGVPVAEPAIMVVDDAPANLRLLIELLQVHDYRVLAFSSGKAALAEARQNPPDLILLDIRMPGMDGFEFCHRLKRDQRLQVIPVLFISALEDAAEKLQAYAAGGVDYVTKPFEATEVLARVKTHLRLHRLVKESEERNRVLMEELPDIVLRFDRHARHCFVSNKIRRLFDLDPKAYIGRTHRELGFPQCQCVQWEGLIASVFSTGQPIEVEMRFPMAHRKHRIHNVRALPERDASGGIDTVVALSRDVTEQKATEESLIRAQRQVHAAHRIKNEFLANMKHEIRTPLNGVFGALDLLAGIPLGKLGEEYVRLGQQSANRLHTLLSEMFSLSSLESGITELKNESFSLDEICRFVCEAQMTTAKEKGITLNWHVDTQSPNYLYGDKDKLRHILFNLVGNGLKFTDIGLVLLQATDLPSTTTGVRRILFSVKDTGRGMDEDKLEQLTCPVTQKNSSLARDHQGIGLGLVLVRRLVHLMQGTMNIESVPGEGTTVHIALPFARET